MTAFPHHNFSCQTIYNFFPVNEKERWIYFWPLCWEKQNSSDNSDSFVLLKTLYILLFESTIGYILDKPVHGAMALPIQSNPEFHSVYFKSLLQPTVFENAGLYFNQTLPPQPEFDGLRKY